VGISGATRVAREVSMHHEAEFERKRHAVARMIETFEVRPRGDRLVV
jgi:hypothetical protein